jgi:hypothetical protein
MWGQLEGQAQADDPALLVPLGAGKRSSAARTSSGDLAEVAAISSGDAGLPLANKSSVGGMISRKALPPVVLIGAVIRAASSWSSLVFIWYLLSGT